MLGRFEDEEQLIRLITTICSYARIGFRVSDLDSCNTCAKTKCPYRPGWGQPVRWNCPFWKGE